MSEKIKITPRWQFIIFKGIIVILLCKMNKVTKMSMDGNLISFAF
jgi:hypothetical protein